MGFTQPEESISVQHSIGADIIMQLDDVGTLYPSWNHKSKDFHMRIVSSLTVGPRVAEAMERSVRWLDRCIAHHEKSGKKSTQNLFAIGQGGLDPDLRDKCLDAMIERREGVAGYAIGGLSGGEEKGKTLHVLLITTDVPDRCILEGVCIPCIISYNDLCSSLESSNVPIVYLKTVSWEESKSDSALKLALGPRYSMGIGFAEGTRL